MRAMSRARWATCALAIVIAVPVATADPGGAHKSIASCASFDQVDKDEATVALTVSNTCSIPLDCSISWRVVCAPDSRKRRVTHRGAATFTLATAGARSAEASAAVCGDDAWAIDAVTWSCAPNQD